MAATQYPSAEVIDQQIRTQLTIRIMLRVASGEQVNVILGQGYGSTISPTSIGPGERGGLWIVGTPDAPRPVRARAHWVTDTDVAARVAATRHLTPHHTTVFGALGSDPTRNRLLTAMTGNEPHHAHPRGGLPGPPTVPTGRRISHRRSRHPPPGRSRPAVD